MRGHMWRTIAVVAAGALLAACGRRLHVQDNAFQQDVQLPAGGTVHLRNTNGRITVVPSSGTTIRLQGSKRWHHGNADDVHFMWKLAGSDLYACAVWGTRGECDEQGYRSNRPSMSILRVFSLLRGRRSDMTADLTVALPPGFAVEATDVNGPVRVGGATRGVHVASVNGSIDLQSVAGPVDAKSVNGSIHATIDSLPADAPLRLVTVNGSVTVRAPDSIQGQIRLSTVNGGATTDFPVTLEGQPNRRQIEGAIGSSPREVVLESVNGSVRLLRAGAGAVPMPPAAPPPARVPPAR